MTESSPAADQQKHRYPLSFTQEWFLYQGARPDRPVDVEGAKSLQLERRGREFFFSQGLM